MLDFSLYEVRDGDGVAIDDDNTTPTITFEVAHTQPTRNTRGVLLVVAVDLVHNSESNPKPVTWSHWEADVRSYRVVKDRDDHKVDDSIPYK